MYDTVRFMLEEKDLNNEVSFIEEVPCLLDKYNSYGNKVSGYLKNMKVEIRGSRLFVEGSLTKYIVGDNYTKTLSLQGVKLAIMSLGIQLGIPLEKAIITRIDVALNLGMKFKPTLYMGKLSHLERYHRSNIEKESLYFDKYNSQLLFYDKCAEVKSSSGIELKCHVLRYEMRFLKVKQYFKREVKGTDLYDVNFCQRLIDEWHGLYMKIKKCQDGLERVIEFNGRKKFMYSCVDLCSRRLNIRELLDEAFVKGEVSSIEKHNVKKLLDECERVRKCVEGQSSVIDELTNKIQSEYGKIKKKLRFNVFCEYWRI